MIIVALTGLQSAGRSIVASRMVAEHGFVTHRFEGPIRRMLAAGLGLSDDVLDARDKNSALAEYGGVTLRQMKRTLGQEWGRRMIHSDVWVTAWTKSMPAADRIVADDLGFSNEALAIHRLGGELWMVDRPSIAPTDHPAELVMRELPVDRVIKNSSSIAALIATVDEAAAAVIARQKP